jgi:hypothetical protein
MYIDVTDREIPSSAIRALGSTMGSGGFIQATQQQVNSYRSEWEQFDEECGGRACPAIALPYNCPEGSTIRFTGAPPTGGCCDYPAYVCDSASYYPQATEPSGGGGSFQSDSNIPTSFQGGFPIPQYDPLSAVSEEEQINTCAGVRCIALYKPCPEGYIDGSPCCPNTGNCIPDPNYVEQTPTRGGAGGLVGGIGDSTTYRSNVVVDYPASQFDQTTPIAIATQNYLENIKSAQNAVSLTPPESQYTLFDTPILTPISSVVNTPVASPSLPVGSTPSTNLLPVTTETPTTQTTTTEEPKQSGLGILAIGLIALKVLAT